MQSDRLDRALDDDLRQIGAWPRLLSLGFLTAVVVLASSVGYAWWWGVLMLGGSVLVILALRVRASATQDEFVVRSYLRTYRFRFDEVLAFTDLPYQGWWSGYTPAELFGWGAFQIDVAGFGKRGRSLPATMCGRKRCERIADGLNARLPNEAPE